jgi:hypothetical protein
MCFRFAGGGGIPNPIQNVLSVLFSSEIYIPIILMIVTIFIAFLIKKLYLKQ